MNKTTSMEIFGIGGRARIFEYITMTEQDFSVGDVANGTEITRQGANRLLKELEKERIVIKTRIVGNIPLYKLNQKNDLVKLMVCMYQAIENHSNLIKERNKQR